MTTPECTADILDVMRGVTAAVDRIPTVLFRAIDMYIRRESTLEQAQRTLVSWFMAHQCDDLHYHMRFRTHVADLVGGHFHAYMNQPDARWSSLTPDTIVTIDGFTSAAMNLVHDSRDQVIIRMTIPTFFPFVIPSLCAPRDPSIDWDIPDEWSHRLLLPHGIQLKIIDRVESDGIIWYDTVVHAA